MSRLFNPLPADDRSTEEQLRDLGVEVIKKNTGAVTGVKWVQKSASRKPVQPSATISEKRLYINVAATKMLNSRGKSYGVGAGDYQGQRVLLLRESDHGYSLSIVTAKGSTYATSVATSLLHQLHRLGLKPGRYELIAIKGGWMGVPENN